MARYLGVDLHRNRFTVCTIAENGRRYRRTYTMRQLEAFVAGLRPNDEIAVEATTNTRLFVGAVRDVVRRVVVVNPTKFKVIAESVKKTDAHDAELLAYFLSKDMLPEVRMKDKYRERLHSLAQTRDKLVKQRTQLKNKINNVLAGYGILLKREELSSKKKLREVLTYEIDEVALLELGVIVEQILHLNAGIGKLEEVMKKEGEKSSDHGILKSIKGIGDKGASILLSIIGDVNDFEEEGKLFSYFGLVPRVQKSNETVHTGRITKRGTKLGRTTLVQCALVAKKYSPYLHSYHERIKARRGGGKANIALARKLLSIIYQALRGRWKFTDFARFEYVELV